MVETCAKKPDRPLKFGTNTAESWRVFEQKCGIYTACAFSEKATKVIAFMLLNLAGPDAIVTEGSFQYLPGRPNISLQVQTREDLQLPQAQIQSDMQP